MADLLPHQALERSRALSIGSAAQEFSERL